MSAKIKLPHPFIVIAITGMLLYARSFSFGYTNFDDNSLIRENQSYISNIFNVSDAFKKTVFITGSDVFYRPMETIWFILNAQLGGDDLFVYHLSSVLLHTVAACLIFLLLARLTDSKEASLFLSLAFLVHPVLTQAVAWVPGVVDVLVTVFSVSSFLFFLDFIKSQKRKHFIPHVLFFALALYTKETAIGMIPVCLIYLHFIEKEKLISYNKKVFLAGWAAVAVIWFIMRDGALQNQQVKPMREMLSSVPENLPGFIQYIGKILFPFNLSVMPVMRDTTFLFGIGALLLFSAGVFFSRRKNTGKIFFAVTWFVIFLLPTFIHTSEFRVHQFYEHRMYLPMAGILLLVSEMDWMKKFSFQKNSSLLMGGASILFFFVLTFSHQKVFSDTNSFLDNAVKMSPSSSLAHRNRAIYLQEVADRSGHKDMALLQNAAEEYRKSLLLNPYEKDLHANLGVLYDWMGKRDSAEMEYFVETKLNPSNSHAWHNLGVIYGEKNEHVKAEEYLKKAVELRPDPATFSELAKVYHKLGKQKEYAEIMKKLQPAGEARPQIAKGAEEKPMTQMEAETMLLKKLSVDSSDRQALYNLGLLYYQTGRRPEAEKMWRKTIQSDSMYVEAYNNLAIVLAMQGKNSEAEKWMKKAIAIDPDYVEGYFNLANFYVKNGNEKEALVFVRELKKRGAGKEKFSNITPELEKLFDTN